MKKICSLVIILLLILSFMCGCDPYSMHDLYPNERSDKWCCEELNFILNLNQDTSELKWNDHVYIIEFAMQASYFAIILAPEDGVTENNVLLDGHWSYRDKKLILEINTDNLFDGKFKSLTFEPVE